MQDYSSIIFHNIYYKYNIPKGELTGKMEAPSTSAAPPPSSYSSKADMSSHMLHSSHGMYVWIMTSVFLSTVYLLQNYFIFHLFQYYLGIILETSRIIMQK